MQSFRFRRPDWLKSIRKPTAALCWATGTLAALSASLLPTQTQTAVANGDTRTIHLYHSHTKESIDATFRVNGSYDGAVLDKLNWFLRDWRLDEPTKMDPRLFDTIWEVYRDSGSSQPIVIVSAYRSPQTNAMLRRRSSGVAKFSQHMLGKAMDMHYADVPMSKIRELGMRLQRGGVGYYPTSGTPFVHLDVGSVRAWPRMTYDQLARLFPDGKTVHIAASGQLLAHYEEARAEIEQRGGRTDTQVVTRTSKGLFATLFGGGEDDEEKASTVRRGGRQIATRGGSDSAAPVQVASVNDDGGARSFLSEQNRAPDSVVRAERNLPRGQTFAGPAPKPAAEPRPTSVAAVAPPVDKPVVELKPIVEPKTSIAASVPPAVSAPDDDVPPKASNAPLPPRRPMALIASLFDRSAPLPPVRPGATVVASLEPQPVANRDATVAPDAKPSPNAKPAPVDTVGALIGTTIPATTTSGTTPGSGQTTIARAQPLPSIITQGTGAARPAADVLAYAASGETPSTQRPAPAKPAQIASAGPRLRPTMSADLVPLVPARLDRSNFRALTDDRPAAQVASQSAAGAPVAMRAAARVQAQTSPLAPAPLGIPGRFGSRPAEAAATNFQKQAATDTLIFGVLASR